MRQRLTFVLMIAFSLPLCMPMIAAAQQKPLANKDVIDMVKGGLAESVVISAIQVNPANYDVSPAALLTLKKAGVTAKEQDAMLAAMKAASAAASPASPSVTTQPPSPSNVSPENPRGWRMPTVTVAQGGASQPIVLEKAQLAQTKTKPTSMSGLAGDSVVSQALQGGINTATYGVASKVTSPIGGATVQQAGGLFSGVVAHRKPTVTYVWGLANPVSTTILQNFAPSFAVNFANAPGINADEYEPAIVKLTPAQSTCRIVGATQGKEDAKESAASDWQIYSTFLEERVVANADKTKSGQYNLTPASPLLPGEYAVVLRPVAKTKKFSGADVARGQGDGFAFNAVWSFQIAAPQ